MRELGFVGCLCCVILRVLIICVFEIFWWFVFFNLKLMNFMLKVVLCIIRVVLLIKLRNLFVIWLNSGLFDRNFFERLCIWNVFLGMFCCGLI